MKKLLKIWSRFCAIVLLGGFCRAGGVNPDSLPLPPPPSGLTQPALPTLAPPQARPSVEVALMQSSAASAAPEVLWSDDSTVKAGAQPSVPIQESTPQKCSSPSVSKESQDIPHSAFRIPHSDNPQSQSQSGPAVPQMEMPRKAVPVEQVLAVIGQEAPKNATLESMLFDQLRGMMPQGSDGYIFDKVLLPALTNLPSKDWTVKYDFRLPAQGIGQASFTGTVLGASSKPLRTFTGALTIDREAAGVQVTRVIHRGETLRAGDTQILGTRLSLLPRGAVDKATELSGTVVRQELRPGQWLTDQMVQRQQVIKMAQPVRLIVQRGAIRITAPGIARQAGAIGEVIRVENPQSQRSLFAKVLSNEEVQVVF